MGIIRVGTSSWADRLLLRSGWYPRSANTPATRIAHYATRFALVEADTVFYALPKVESTAVWAENTPAGFTFDVKAFRLFTGHPTPASVLPADLRPADLRPADPRPADPRSGGPRSRGSDRLLRRRDLTPEAYDELWTRFHAALEPLAAAGKLGVVMLQFPPWLAHGEAAKRRIAQAAWRCRPARVAVEFRHASWLAERNAADTLLFLRSEEISYGCVDMPQGFPSSIPPALVATAAPAVIRFHGHSPHWESGDKEERFRYAYGERELRHWAGLLREFADEAGELHVLMNNCCGDQAQRDAARLAELLADLPGDRPAAPSPVRGAAVPPAPRARPRHHDHLTVVPSVREGHTRGKGFDEHSDRNA